MDRDEWKALAFAVLVLMPTMILLSPLLLYARWLEARAERRYSINVSGS